MKTKNQLTEASKETPRPEIGGSRCPILPLFRRRLPLFGCAYAIATSRRSKPQSASFSPPKIRRSALRSLGCWVMQQLSEGATVVSELVASPQQERSASSTRLRGDVIRNGKCSCALELEIPSLIPILEFLRFDFIHTLSVSYSYR